MLVFTVPSIKYVAQDSEWRTGQALFNLLPGGLANSVAGTSFDPFFRDLTDHELQEWIDNHLILNDKQEPIAVFHNNRILSELSYS